MRLGTQVFKGGRPFYVVIRQLGGLIRCALPRRPIGGRRSLEGAARWGQGQPITGRQRRLRGSSPPRSAPARLTDLHNAEALWPRRR